MVINIKKSLGPGHHSARLQDRVHLSPPCKIRHHEVAYQTLQPKHLSRSPGLGEEGCCNPGPRISEGSGVLFNPILSKEKGRRLPDHHKLKTTEQVYSLQEVQDGVSQILSAVDKARGIYVLDRPERCLSARPHSPRSPEVSKVCCPRPFQSDSSFPVYSTALRDFSRSKALHQTCGRDDSPSQTGGIKYSAISGRFPSHSGLKRSPAVGPGSISIPPISTRLDSERTQVNVGSIPEGEISGSYSRLRNSVNLSSTEQNPVPDKQGEALPTGEKMLSEGSNEPNRPPNLLYTLGRVGTGSLPCDSDLAIVPLEQEEGFSGLQAPNPRISKEVPLMVDEGEKSVPGSPMDQITVDYRLHGRQPIRLGSKNRQSLFPRNVEASDICSVFKFQGAVCSKRSPSRRQASDTKSAREGPIGQRDCGLLPKTPGGYSIKETPEYLRGDLLLCRKGTKVHLSNAPEGIPESRSGLFEQTGNRSYRVGTEPRGLQYANPKMGASYNRPVCIKEKYEGANILLPKCWGPSLESRRLLPKMVLGSRVCIPSIAAHPEGHSEDSGGENHGNTDRSVLAQEELVRPSIKASNRRTSETPTQGGHPIPGSFATSSSGVPEAHGLDPEVSLLRSQGLSDQVIATLRCSRKKVTSAIYLKIWKRFCSWSGEENPNSVGPSIQKILEFLQKGLDMGLSPSTLKVQVSALSAFFDSDLADHRWIKRFIRAARRLRPTLRSRSPTWDLNLVLNNLMCSPFEPLEDCSIKLLSFKTAFLIAITSAKRLGEIQALSIREPYLTITEDKIVLKLDPGFLPKVASDRNRGQEILLPSFFNNPKDQEEEQFHFLDVRRTVIRYLEATRDFRKSDSLLVQFAGRNKGSRASKSSIARWIKDTITLCYKNQNLDPPSNIRAHSTRAVSTTFAERAGASLDDICRAASWSSIHTFVKHYRLDLSGTSGLSFGQKVLQAVAPTHKK
ncbi:uncharacterized protein LOC122922220 isoform X1 [Bufo gargarizans]|uniref:uncharacterized protein LOC122922220 isoform X1 n=1 Tax=Bufo gargarizans TaxID=30331 RepID=UPI001CF4E4FC|nr:uncharacterized protein LOC122922220 isoform X1 [Bufo gargarizans]